MNSIHQKYVVSDRTDGLGGRIRSLLFAMLEADKRGCGFKFTWKQNPKLMVQAKFHELPTSDTMFTKKFLDEHLLEELEDVANCVITHGNETDELLCKYNGARNLKKYFNKIGFRSPFRDAIEHAESVDIPNDAIAVHVRSGDIVFGNVREKPRHMEKTIPLPIAILVVQEQIKLGRSVIVFGQDDHSISVLEHEGAVAAARYTPYDMVNVAGRDLFEIVLMSRCKKILAGTSIFARMACLIGNASISNPMNEYDAVKIIEITDKYRDEAGATGNLIASHAYKYVYFIYKDSLDSSKKIYILNKMIILDPNNAIYLLLLASEYINIGNYVEANDLLKQKLNEEYLLKRRIPSKSMLKMHVKEHHKDNLYEQINIIINNIGRGYSYIDLFGAFGLYRQNYIIKPLMIIVRSSKNIDRMIFPFKLFFYCLWKINFK